MGTWGFGEDFRPRGWDIHPLDAAVWPQGVEPFAGLGPAVPSGSVPSRVPTRASFVWPGEGPDPILAKVIFFSFFLSAYLLFYSYITIPLLYFYPTLYRTLIIFPPVYI